MVETTSVKLSLHIKVIITMTDISRGQGCVCELLTQQCYHIFMVTGHVGMSTTLLIVFGQLEAI